MNRGRGTRVSAKLRLHHRPAILVLLEVILAFALVAVAGLSGADAAAKKLSCGETITAKLDSDLLNCPNNGIIVAANDVTIDLNGHTIDGDDALDKSCGKTEICDVGIASEGYDGLTVRGKGILRQFALGALVLDANEPHFRKLRMRHNIFSGMVLAGARNAHLGKLRISANGLDTDQAGLSFFDSRNTLISRNTISANGDIGIFTEGSIRSRIVHNRFAANPEGGIIGDGQSALIAHNRFARNGDGIGWGGDDNVIRANSVSGSSARGEGGGQGIEFGGGKHNRIVGNTIRDVDKHGVVIEAFGPIRGMVAARNSVHSAGEDGLVVRDVVKSARRVSLRANHAVGSKDDGIDVAIKSAKLTDNVARNNGDYGIEADDGVEDGGGNHAKGNGDPRQCVNVKCR